MFNLFYLWVQLSEQMWVHKFDNFEVNMQRKYKKKNDSEIKIRLPEKLKNDFCECCELLDVPVAEVIRVLMSDFMKENQSFLLTKGSLPVDGRSAKRIVKRKERESSEALVPIVKDIIEPLDHFYIDENLVLRDVTESELNNVISKYGEDWLTDNYNRYQESLRGGAPLYEDNSVYEAPETLPIQKPSFGNPNLSRAQRRAMESNKRKKK